MDETLGEGAASPVFEGPEVRAHNERVAERLLAAGLAALKLDDARLRSIPKGCLEKRALAWLMKHRTSVRNAWIAERLVMGHPCNLPNYTRRLDGDTSSPAQKMKRILNTLKY